MVATAEVKGQINLTALFDGTQIAVSVEMQPPMSITINFGGGNGVTAHEDLTGRSLPDAHPISSITGLSAEILEAKSSASTALSVAQGKEDKGVAATQVAAIVDGVASGGDTLKKLYNLIVASFTEVTVADITERNAYNAPQGGHVFVTNDGDGKWALYKATTAGVNATYIKLSDPDLLNAAMTGSAIKIAYESNPDTNAFTNALLARLNGLSATSSPEFAALLITTLDSVANGGVIANAEATWLGATAKNMLSYLQKLVSKVFSIDGRVAVLEDDLIYEVLTTAPTASISITLDKNGQPFSLYECVVYIINPSWPSNTMYLRVNNILTAVYNSYTSVNISRFNLIGGELGGQGRIALRYDENINTVTMNATMSRIYAGPSFATYPITGFINFGAITSPISRLDILPNTGVIPVGTKIILKKK